MTQHSLDIEVAVANGALGVGIFCAEEMVDLAQAQGIVHDIRSILEELCAGAAE